MLIQLTAFILFLVNFLSNGMWNNSLNDIMMMNWTQGSRDKYLRRTKRVSLATLVISIILLLSIGHLATLSWFNVLFYLALIPIVFIFFKSYREKTPLLDTALFKKGYLNALLVETPGTYIYILVWVTLLITFAQGPPGMYEHSTTLLLSLPFL